MAAALASPRIARQLVHALTEHLSLYHAANPSSPSPPPPPAPRSCGGWPRCHRRPARPTARPSCRRPPRSRCSPCSAASAFAATPPSSSSLTPPPPTPPPPPSSRASPWASSRAPPSQPPGRTSSSSPMRSSSPPPQPPRAPIESRSSSRESSPSLHVLVVPGNPGIVGFYKDFVEALCELVHGDSTVRAISVV